MPLLWNPASTVLFCILCLGLVTATSFRKEPFKRALFPQSPSVRLVRRHQNLPFGLQQPSNQEIRYDDTFLLQFGLDNEPVSILLRPSQALVHPSGVKVVTPGQPDEFIQRSQIRAYKGIVLEEAAVERYWAEEVARVHRPFAHDDRIRGHASITLRNDEAWEGNMFIDHQVVHFKPLHAYVRDKTQWDADAPIPALARRGRVGGGTVILRERDAMTVSEFNQASNSKRSLTGSSCSHDHLQANQAQAQADYLNIQQAFSKPAWAPFRLPWLSAADDVTDLSPLDRRGEPAPLRHLMPRQDIIGGNNSTSSFAGSIGSTVGCPKEQKVLYVGVAIDCTAVLRLGSQDEARTSALSYINSVSSVYAKTFNVSIGVVELQVMNQTCPSTATSSEPWNVGCDASGVDLNQRLSLFSQWRSDKGGADGAGLWHLLTTCQTGSEVGVAWLSALCKVSASSTSGQTTSGTGVTSLTDRTWQVIAHEMGHNFGAIHDCDTGCTSSNTQSGSPCCPLTTSSCNANSAFIMSPVSSQNTTTFSQCTLGNVCATISGALNTTCLYDPGNRDTLSTNQCGNGILEPGEECDPGSSGSRCCTSQCKLSSGSVCDPSNSACCTSSCQYASSSVVCRPAVNSQCDQAENCTGTSATCPEDKKTKDGDSCGTKGQGLYCANGQCTSRDEQCQSEGSSLNVTKACSSRISSTCQLTCADPSSSNSCILLDSTFTDGTECGLAGRCKSGSCENGSFSNTVSAWVKRNPQIAIPVFVVGGIVILLVLLSLIRCCFWKRKSKAIAPSAQYAKARQRQRKRGPPPTSTAAPPPQGPPMQNARASFVPLPSQQSSFRNSDAEYTPQNVQQYRPPSFAPPPGEYAAPAYHATSPEAPQNWPPSFVPPQPSYGAPSYPPPAAAPPDQSSWVPSPARNSGLPSNPRMSNAPSDVQPVRYSQAAPTAQQDHGWLVDDDVRRINGQ